MKAIAIVDEVGASGNPQGQSQRGVPDGKHQTARGQRYPGSPMGTAHTWRRPGVKFCPPGSVLRVTFYAAESGDGRIYGQAYGLGVHHIQDGDVFEYEMMWKEPDCNCGVDFEAGAPYRHRDHGSLDQHGYSPHSEMNTNMSAAVTRQWLKRSWPLEGTEVVGKFVDKWVFSAKLQPGQRRTAYFRSIRMVTQEGVARKTIFGDGGETPSINAYFAGGFETGCQDQILVEAPGSGISHDVLRAGSTVVFAGEITASLLSDPLPSWRDTGAVGVVCRMGASHPLLTLRAVHHDQVMRLDIVEYRVVARHADYSAVVLWDIASRHFRRAETPPIPFWIPMRIPPLSPLSTVLNSSILEMYVFYRLPGIDDLVNVTVFSQRLSAA